MSGDPQLDKVDFLVQGSSPVPYKVSFVKRANNMSASCSCPAGAKRVCCKHIIGIVQGEDVDIVSTNNADLRVVKEWFVGTSAEAVLKEVQTLESALEHAKKDLSIAKRKLSRELFG